ncbi:MAG: SRPBCC family protein [Acidimicrobiales bacterium]
MAASDTTPDPSDPSPAPGDEATLRIAAPHEELYRIVTEVGAMGRLSPECTGGQWLDGASGPVVGARFKGHNKRGWARWSTTNTVVAAEPGQEFAFETKQSGTRWRYRFQPDGDATVVIESREACADRPLVAKVFATLALGGAGHHEDEMRQGMLDTLHRLKDVAEGATR